MHLLLISCTFIANNQVFMLLFSDCYDPLISRKNTFITSLLCLPFYFWGVYKLFFFGLGGSACGSNSRLGLAFVTGWVAVCLVAVTPSFPAMLLVASLVAMVTASDMGQFVVVGDKFDHKTSSTSDFFGLNSVGGYCQ